jgi:CRP-like cAMP-binding protein
MQQRSLVQDEPEVWPASERTSWEGRPLRNRLLLSIPENEFQALRPFLSHEHFPHHAHLHDAGEELGVVHFPNRGLVSLIIATREGRTVEVGIVGNEGLVGLPALAGLKRSPYRAVVQIVGDGVGIRVEILQNVLSGAPALQSILSRYAVIQAMNAAQIAACNRLHGIEQRQARWLLMMQDQTEDSSLQITHDFLATMLGTDRPSVTLAAGDLQRRGAIKYTRGTVRIVNRQLLEGASCECYEVMQHSNSLLRTT